MRHDTARSLSSSKNTATNDGDRGLNSCLPHDTPVAPPAAMPAKRALNDQEAAFDEAPATLAPTFRRRTKKRGITLRPTAWAKNELEDSAGYADR